jgi:DNA-binding GntR family transcriptional regulator
LDEQSDFQSRTPTVSEGGGAGESLAGKVVDAICSGVLRGRYVPGQKLIESDLTRTIKVSRGPVREALTRLEADGIVRISRNKGAYICSLSRTETEDLFEILVVITPLISRIAAEKIAKTKDARRIKEAEDLLRKFNDPALSLDQYMDMRRQFYDALISIGANSQMNSVMPLMRIHLVRLQFQPYIRPHDRKESLDEYRAITQAVLAGDKVAAERAMKNHVKRIRAQIALLPDEAFADED